MASIGGTPSGVTFPYGLGGATSAVPQGPPQMMQPASNQSSSGSGRFQPLGLPFLSVSRGNRHGSAERSSATSTRALGPEIRGRERDGARDRHRDVDEPRLQIVSPARQHSQLEMENEDEQDRRDSQQSTI